VTGYGNDTHITYLLDNLEYHLVPVVNVDGYLYTWTTDRMWRKTTKPNPGSSCLGTDPNRNWDNHWCLPGVGGSTDPCDDSYCGSAPFSEACVKTVADYVNSQENIQAAIDFHSYSQLWMTPYGYTSGLPSNNDAQTAMSVQAVAALQAVYNTSYTEGPIYSTVYPASGSSADWFYDNTTNSHVQYSFGVELRDTGTSGFLLPPNQIIPSGIETLAAVVSMGDYLLKNPLPIGELPTEVVHFGNMKQYARRNHGDARPALNKKYGPGGKKHPNKKSH
jgi:carboxypeptidase B